MSHVLSVISMSGTADLLLARRGRPWPRQRQLGQLATKDTCRGSSLGPASSSVSPASQASHPSTLSGAFRKVPSTLFLCYFRESFRKTSGKLPGKNLGTFQEMSRKIPENLQEISGKVSRDMYYSFTVLFFYFFVIL